MQKKFHSKIDIWLLLLLLVAIALPLLILILVSFYEPTAMSIPALITIAIVFVLIVYMCVSVRYIIDFSNKTLFVTTGFGKHGIAIDDIVSIERTNSVLSAPALSLDRIAIKYQKQGKKTLQSIIISPKKRQEFIEDILKINPNVRIK